jgi:hypothetical protein
MKELQIGDKVKVGDIIKSKHAFGENIFTVKRTTKRYSFAIIDGLSYEHKFPIEYSWGFQTLPRTRWSTTEYKVYRKEVEE